MAKRKKEDEDLSKQNADNINESDDSFGLPEIEFEPIRRDEPQNDGPPVAPEPPKYTPQEPEAEEPDEEPTREVVTPNRSDSIFMKEIEEEKPSAAPKIIGILLVLALLAGAGWYYFGVYKPQKEAERLEAEASLKAKERRERERQEALEREKQQRIADSLANLAPKVGVIETLTERTGRYYVVVTSDIDDDLLMDYAKKLSAQGVSTKVIPPFGKVMFHRLAVADSDTYPSAQGIADGMKPTYGDSVWVVKY